MPTINESRSVRAGGVAIEVTGDPIEHNLDPAELGAAVAAAIRDAIAAGIKGITQSVSAATMRYREEARKALARGAPWAVARYAGGRTPGSGTTLFNDSGELADGIAMVPSGDSFDITAPGDRLGDLPGASAGSMIARLRDLVPALRDPLGVPAVRAALEASWSKLVRRR